MIAILFWYVPYIFPLLAIKERNVKGNILQRRNRRRKVATLRRESTCCLFSQVETQIYTNTKKD